MIHPLSLSTFTIDEALLRRVDRDPEAKKRGRSAFLRRAVEEYLKRKRDRAIASAYRRGYGEHQPAEDEFGWGEHSWPEE